MGLSSTQWSEDFETGIDWQDSQHKQLVDKLQKLYEAILDQIDDVVVKEIIAFLDVYVAKHFGMEEMCMNENLYPKTAAHCAEHKQFVKDFNELRKLYDDPSVLAGTMLAYDLHEWLVNHIQKADKELGEFLNSL